MRRRLPLILLSLLAHASSFHATYPDEIPVPRPPGICNLRVARTPRSNDVTISWSGGTPPFSIVRADAECFGKATEIRHLQDNVEGRLYVDAGALKDDRRYWYQVYDDNSAMEIWYVGPEDPNDADPKVIHPDGNGDCGDMDTCRGSPRKPRTWK